MPGLCVVLLFGLTADLAQAATHDAVVLVVGDAHSESTARYALERIGAASVRGASASALRQASARQVLRRLPRLYTESRFDACAEEVGRIERDLATELPRQADDELSLLKQLNFWNGVCRAGAGAARSANRSFALAARLRGPEPDRELFSPDIWQHYQRAQESSRRRCRVHLPTEIRWIVLDGQKMSAGGKAHRGDHYAVWDAGHGVHSDRVHLGANCRLTLPEPPPAGSSRKPATLPQIADALVSDTAFLADVGRADRAPEVLVVGVGGGEARVRLFAVAGGRWLMMTQAAIGPDQAAGEVLRGLMQQVLATAVPVEEAPPTSPPTPTSQVDSNQPATEPPTAESPPTDPDVPSPPSAVSASTTEQETSSKPEGAAPRDGESDRWWIWPLVGGVSLIAVAAVAIPIVVFWPEETSPDPDRRYDLVF